MIQLAYYSRNMVGRGDRLLLSELRVLLDVSRKNNVRDGLTGFLLVHRDWFVQIIEGEREQVESAYRRIQRDPRHADLVILSERTIRARSFPEWSMAGAAATLETEEILLRHGIGASFDPSRLSFVSIIAMAMDLQDHQRSARAAVL